MTTQVQEINGIKIAVTNSTEKIITDPQSALDFMMTIQYETESRRIVINKDAIVEDFFVLSTRLAGEILQKFVNYNMKIAIVGDFSQYTSKPLKDFIYECNNGKDVFFYSTEEEAVKKLASV